MKFKVMILKILNMIHHSMCRTPYELYSELDMWQNHEPDIIPRIGKRTSEADVTNISSHGIWILYDNEELFLSYTDFPWFKDVIVRKILNITEPLSGHFYWPELDVDLSVEIIKHPERFPMKAKWFV
jgi:hypothetical protein